MKLICTLLLTSLLFTSLMGQFELTPEVILIETEGEDVEIKVDITNNSGEFANIYWMYEKGEDFLEDWRVIFYDKVACYVPDKFKSSPNLPNPMEPGESFEFYIRVLTQGMEGASYLILHIYDDPNCENEVATSKPPSLAVNDNNIERLAIFPNPTLEYFSIKNDEKVSSIDIINSIGQVLISASHSKNKIYSVEELESGVFIVVLKDSEGEIITSLYLSKH